MRCPAGLESNPPLRPLIITEDLFTLFVKRSGDYVGTRKAASFVLHRRWRGGERWPLACFGRTWRNSLNYNTCSLPPIVCWENGCDWVAYATGVEPVMSLHPSTSCRYNMRCKGHYPCSVYGNYLTRCRVSQMVRLCPLSQKYRRSNTIILVFLVLLFFEAFDPGYFICREIRKISPQTAIPILEFLHVKKPRAKYTLYFPHKLR